MTAEELIRKFNDEFGIEPWPSTYDVDAETYGYACQHIIKLKDEGEILYWNVVLNGKQKPDIGIISVAIGPNKGLMFKNVELLLVRK